MINFGLYHFSGLSLDLPKNTNFLFNNLFHFTKSYGIYSYGNERDYKRQTKFNLNFEIYPASFAEKYKFSGFHSIIYVLLMQIT